MSPPCPRLARGFYEQIIIRVLGRIPSGINDLTDDEKRAIADQCLGGHDAGTADSGGRSDFPVGQGGLDDQGLQCVIATIGRVPAGENDLSDEEKRAVAELCFGQREPGLDSQGRTPRGSNGPGDLDEETIQCIVSVLDRMLQSESDFTNEEKRAVGRQCFAGHDGGPDGSNGPGRISVEEEQCIIRVLGRMPEGEDDLTHEEKLLLGQECFAGQHGGEQGGPGDLDQETIQCIVETIGRMPSGKDDLTNEEERAIGQACFGGAHGGPGDLDEETLQCIENVLGFLPSGPDDLSDEEKRLVGRECFGDEHGGPGDLDEATIQCVVDILGYMPSGPDDLTDAEKIRVGLECFGEEHGGPGGDLDQQTIQCIVDLVGFLPSGPDDLTDEEKRLVGRECFEQDPDDLDEESRQCIIGVLGYLPDSPEELNDEDMDLVMRTCFEDEHQGPDGGGDLDQETLQCIVATIGRLPSGPGDLSDNEKRVLGRECFGGGRDNRPTRVAARGMSAETKECIVDLIGRLPEGPDDLTDEEKRLIGRECFEQRTRTRSVGQPTVRADDEDSVGSATADEQPQQPLTTGGGQTSGQTGGQQATGDDEPSQETEEPQATVSQQPEQEEDTGAGVTRPALVLTRAQQKIKDLIVEHNIEVKEMEVIGVIGRLASQAGSLTKGIQILTIVNPLVLKGKDVSDDEWREVFEQLEESGIEIRD